MQTTKLDIGQRVHRAPITGLKYLQNDYQAVSASVDGAIIIWEMRVTKRGGKPLQQLHRLDTPPSRSPDGQIVSGILQI